MVELNKESLVPTIAELERIMEWAYGRKSTGRTLHPKVVVVIQTKGAKKGQLGAFSKLRWSDREGALVHEVTFTAEEMGRGLLEIVETAVHETVHLYNCDAGVKDCAKGGRHNKAYKAAAEAFGLVVAEPDKSKGYAFTSLGSDLERAVETELMPKVEAFRIFRTTDEPKASRKSTVGFECDCVTVRVASGKADTFDATCQVCNKHFEPVQE